MHIVTGLLLAALAGRSKKTDKTGSSGLLRHTGPLRIKHLVDGRVRFCCSSLINAPSKVEIIEKNLTKLKEVFSVKCNVVSGSIVVMFDNNNLSAEIVAAALIKILNLEKEFTSQPVSLLKKELKSVTQSFDRAVYDQSKGILDLKTSVTISVLSLGLWKLITDRSNIMPASLTLIWWAWHELNRENGN